MEPKRSELRAKAMADAIAYRGPDGADVWSDPQSGVALAHRRLAIVDLTPTGAQPMISADGRWVISYNGEVYNAEAIAAEPQMAGACAPRHVGHRSDPRIGGAARHRAHASTISTACSPSRFGIAPRAHCILFVTVLASSRCFMRERGTASALLPSSRVCAAGGFKFEIEPASVASFLRFGYVPAPHSIYRERHQTATGRSGSRISGGRIRSDSASIGTSRTSRLRGMTEPFAGSDAEAEERLHALLGECRRPST